jgi:hypothetical protein
VLAVVLRVALSGGAAALGEKELLYVVAKWCAFCLPEISHPGAN